MEDNGLSLDDELLKVAGRSSKSTKRLSQRDKDASASKRRKRTASPSSSEDEDSDSEERGQKGAVMPLKKRVERDREDSEEEDEDEINRRKMEGMNEFQREMFLTEQAEKRDAISDRRRLAQTMKQREEAERARQQQKEPRGKDRSTRSSAARDTLANRQSALNELKSRRQGHKGGDIDSRLEAERDRAQARARKSRADDEESESESDDKEEDDEGSGEEEESSREDEDAGDADDSSSDSSSSDDEGLDDAEDVAEAKAEDLRPLLLRRDDMLELFKLPFFGDVVTGCLVRLPHRHGEYRVWEIVEVKEDVDRKYRFGPRETAKVIVVRHGDKSSEAFLDGVSNKALDAGTLDGQIEDWHARRREAGDPVLLSHVTKKMDELAKARSYNYTATDVAKLVEEKRRLASAPGNVAMEKDRWRMLAEAADARGDAADAERCRNELARLERFMAEQGSRASRGTLMEAINKRNMALNCRNMPMNKGAEDAGGAAAQRNTLDPFSRRPTRSQIYWNTGKKKDKEKEGGEKGEGEGVLSDGEGATAKDKGGLSVDVTTTSDGGDGKQGAGTPKPATPSPRVPALGASAVAAAMAAAHDFELDVDLGKLAMAGSAPDGGMARYRAMAMRRMCVPLQGMEVSKRHPLTLTVTDYKRRQGLL
eukprot:jgi/Mesvir1/26847/Mv20598-RA.1